ncbi:hypothetical protein AKJ09_09819 [Labilithrix luteola]|uniref:Uncharacterized protein n=1 Tax=Labilithrix luteola TaxID=1391654 RepID=A0A0K1QBJ4_9BACT|nr:hypothetical protein [Labilithrix luteola]AKV03156.1 hypothetical protein AKJ09_09819 [Labilithrix luteola]
MTTSGVQSNFSETSRNTRDGETPQTSQAATKAPTSAPDSGLGGPGGSESTGFYIENDDKARARTLWEREMGGTTDSFIAAIAAELTVVGDIGWSAGYKAGKRTGTENEGERTRDVIRIAREMVAAHKAGGCMPGSAKWIDLERALEGRLCSACNGTGRVTYVAMGETCTGDCSACAPPATPPVELRVHSLKSGTLLVVGGDPSRSFRYVHNDFLRDGATGEDPEELACKLESLARFVRDAARDLSKPPRGVAEGAKP